MARNLQFDKGEMDRLLVACRALNTSYAEFIRWAVIHALDECDAIARQEQGRNISVEVDGERYRMWA